MWERIAVKLTLLVSLALSGVQTSKLRLDLANRKTASSGEYLVYKNESFYLRAALRTNQTSAEKIEIAFLLPSIPRLLSQPIIGSYQLSSPTKPDDVIVTSNIRESKVTFFLIYNPKRTVDDISILLKIMAVSIDVGDVISIGARANVHTQLVEQSIILSPNVKIRGIGPCIKAASSFSHAPTPIQVNKSSNRNEIRFQSCDGSTEKAGNFKFLLSVSRGFVYVGNFSLLWGANTNTDMFDFSFDKWVDVGDFEVQELIFVAFDYILSNDIVLDSDVTMTLRMKYSSAAGIVYEETMVTTKPTMHVETKKCDVNFNRKLVDGDIYDFTTCVSLPPGTINLDVVFQYYAHSEVTFQFVSGNVTSNGQLRFQNRDFSTNFQNLTPRRFRRGLFKRHYWNIGDVTNLGSTNADVIVSAHLRPERENKLHFDDASVDLYVTSFHRIVKRNVVVSSQELTVSKQVQLLSGSTFRVLLSGKSNVTIYDVVLTETVTGLQLLQIVQPTDQSLVSILPDTLTFVVGNLTSAQTLQFAYEATLSDNGGNVGNIYDIATNIQYYTTPQLTTQRSVTADVCFTESATTSSNCPQCWSIIIIVVCLIVGFLVGFLIILLYLFHSASTIQPSLQKQASKTEKTKSSRQSDNYDDINIVDVLTMKEERQMLDGVDILEFRQLLDLEKRVEEERIRTTNHVVYALLNSKPQKTTYFVDSKMEKFASSLKSKRLSESRKESTSQEKFFQKKIFSETHEEETEHWKNKLNGFTDEFQKEMWEFIEKRHALNLADENFAENLRSLLHDFEVIPDETTVAKCLELLNSNEEDISQDEDELIHNITEAESHLAAHLLEIYSKKFLDIQATTKRRRDVITNINETLEKESKIRNKLLSQLLEVIKRAESQNLISSTDMNDLLRTVSLNFKNSKLKFDDEIQNAKDQVSQKYSFAADKYRRTQRLRNDDVIEGNIDDVKSWIRFQTQNFENSFSKEVKTESELDQIAFALEESINAILKQERKTLKTEKNKLQESLQLLEVEESWIERIFSFQKSEMQDLYEGLEQSNASKATPLGYDVTRLVNPSLQVLQRTVGAQLSTSASDKVSSIRSEAILKATAVKRSSRQSLKERLKVFERTMEKRKLAIDEVGEGADEDGIREELEEKLLIASHAEKKKKKKTQLREKRLRLIVSHRNLQTALTDQLRHHFNRSHDMGVVSRQRCALENFTMALIELMTSSGQLTSAKCKMMLEEFRSQAEEIKNKFSIERKRQEELLKKKAELSLLDKKETSKIYGNERYGEGNNIGQLEELLDKTDDIITTSSKRIYLERSIVQELFEAHRNVYIEKERALVDQELNVIRMLASAAKVGSGEIKETLQHLLPEMCSEERIKLCDQICEDDDDDKKTKAKKHKNLVKLIENAVKRRKEAASETEYAKEKRHPSQYKSYQPRKLMPIKRRVSNLGERPEPLGRTSTPDLIDRYDPRFRTSSEFS